MGARRIFFQGWAMRGMKDESPPAGSWGRTPVGKSWQHFLKIIHPPSSTETLDNICSTKNTLQHFQDGREGKCPQLPMPAGAHDPTTLVVMLAACITKSVRHWSATCGRVGQEYQLQKHTNTHTHTSLRALARMEVWGRRDYVTISQRRGLNV